MPVLFELEHVYADIGNMKDYILGVVVWKVLVISHDQSYSNGKLFMAKAKYPLYHIKSIYRRFVQSAIFKSQEYIITCQI